MSDLFPRMKINRPEHPAADADGWVEVRVSPDDRPGRVYTPFGWVWMTAAEAEECQRLLRERREWMAQFDTRGP